MSEQSKLVWDNVVSEIEQLSVAEVTTLLASNVAFPELSNSNV